VFEISSNFIGDFKLGDNINYNLRLLHLLYEYFDNADGDERRFLCKPIILTLVSINEAVLYDLHTRVQAFTREGVKGLTDTIVAYIRGRQLDKFKQYIDSARKHDLFDAADTAFYERLDDLRRLRNRVHIQNTDNDFEPDERDAFNERRKELAEKALEKTLRTMAGKYPRGPAFNHAADFQLPWQAHFPRG
jgi:hypothetical protein